MKLPRVIRFDESDVRVFAPAAEPDEWAVSGAVLFADLETDALKGKLRQAFANGFLGTLSLGHATFVVVATASQEVAAACVESLARLFVDRLGAPDVETARSIAEAEVAYAVELCDPLTLGSVLAVSRSLDVDGGISERFKVVRAPGADDHAIPLWSPAEDA